MHNVKGCVLQARKLGSGDDPGEIISAIEKRSSGGLDYLSSSRTPTRVVMLSCTLRRVFYFYN